MTQHEIENFWRCGILIVDEGKGALVALLDKELCNQGMSFEDFINKYQHRIFHLCFTSVNCCQCKTETVYKPEKRILNPSQLDKLFDKDEPTLSGHVHGSSSEKEYCCRKAKPGITTGVLDITLSKDILLNFCMDVFWVDMLRQQPQTCLKDFLNRKIHDIYHLFSGSDECCKCKNIKPNTRLLLPKKSWEKLFKKDTSKKECHDVTSKVKTCLCIYTANNITKANISKYEAKILHQHFSALFQAIEVLRVHRNEVYGHATETRIPNDKYGMYKRNIEEAIMRIATFCSNATDVRRRLDDLHSKTLDETILKQQLCTLMEHIDRDNDLRWQMEDIQLDLKSLIDNSKTLTEKISSLPNMENMQDFMGNLREMSTTLAEMKSSIEQKFNEQTNMMDKKLDRFKEENISRQNSSPKVIVQQGAKIDYMQLGDNNTMNFVNK